MSFNMARCCLEEANMNPLSVYRKPSLVTSNAFQILKQWVTNLFCLFRIVTSRRFDCWLSGILLTCAYVQKWLKVFNPSGVLHSEKPEALYLYLQNKKKEVIFPAYSQTEYRSRRSMVLLSYQSLQNMSYNFLCLSNFVQEKQDLCHVNEVEGRVFDIRRYLRYNLLSQTVCVWEIAVPLGLKL